jgi:ribonuclease HII
MSVINVSVKQVTSHSNDNPDFSMEQEYAGPVCGIDEVGRGPLAGPVLAACVYLPTEMHKSSVIKQIKDSKKLSLKKREEIFLEIRKNAVFGIGMAAIEEIDELNIHHATLLAMKRAHEHMLGDFDIRPQTALVDGKFRPELACDAYPVIKGDNKSVSIAAASIMAKVTRDRIMSKLHNEHPYYGWNSNAGYGTAQHMEGIRVHGITKHHRKSFAPIKDMA